MPEKKLDFSGKGFSKEQPTPEELAEWRERHNHYDANYRTSAEFLEETGLKWVSTIAKAAPGFIKSFAAAGTILGVIIAMKKLGVL